MLCLRFAVLLAALLAAWPAPSARAQSQSERAETEERLRELKEQIQSEQERLSQASEQQQASEKKLNTLERQIALRQELAGSYQTRLRQMNAESDSLEQSLATLRGQVEELRGEYQSRATHAYKYGRLHDLALILSARSINEMLVRVRYLRRFAQQRRERLSAIREATETMAARRETIQGTRRRTAALLRDAESERKNLTQLQASRRQVIRELRAQQASLQENIEEKKNTAQQLEARIQQLIAAEARAQRTRAAARSPASRARFARLSGSFEQNQGQLPWPTEGGAVTEPFGTVVNPVYGTETPNPGVLIATSPQAAVQAVFEGEVVKVDAMPDLGTILLLRHGAYLTLYGNFSMLYVGQGDHVEAGQTLGRAGTDGEPRGAGLFFALFKEGQAVDPAAWLRRR